MKSEQMGYVCTAEGSRAIHFQYLAARGFFSRLKGLLFDDKPVSVLLIPKCRYVHTMWLNVNLQLIFLDRFGKVLSVVHRVPPWRFVGHRRAAHVLEVKGHSFPLSAGDRVVCDELPLPFQRRSPAGFSAVEALIALPILLLSTMLVIQVALLWHAKLGVIHAVNVAARHASLQHGSDRAVRDGLVRGLMPLFGRADGLTDIPAALLRTSSELTLGSVAGWTEVQVLSPTRQSFTDWARAVDPLMSPGVKAGEREIPSGPFPALALTTKPRSGSIGLVDGLPIGSASGQTLLDANTMSLRLRLGIPLKLPVGGPLLARALSVYFGCAPIFKVPTQESFGPVRLGAGSKPFALSDKIECRALSAHDIRGRWSPRWPVEGVAMVRMHSPARESVMALRDRPAR